MAAELAGRTALVLGAGSSGPGWGNGKAAAVLLAREGANVFCVDLDHAAALETAELIRTEGGTAEAFAADVSRTNEVGATVAACLDRFGAIDILDNNVGILEVGGVVELEEAVWERVISVNLGSVFLAMKHVLPVMEAQGRGSIVNISSISSLGHTGVSYPAYSTTKAAINQLTRTTAVEYASRGIRVNAVLPGLMKTPMVEVSAGLAQSYASGKVNEMWEARAAQVPMGEMGDAWDVAQAVLFLGSDRARYITGVLLVVDGGLTLKFQ